MRSSRREHLSPVHSLQRLRTVFSSSPPNRSSSSTCSTSPLSACNSSSSAFSGFDFGNFGNHSTASLPCRPDAKRIIRRKKSYLELEQEEERVSVSHDLVALVEPRPQAGLALGTIEEVLNGRA